jgi:iron complex outermembrane receptor protein
MSIMRKVHPFRFSTTCVRNAAILASGILMTLPGYAQVLEEVVVTATKRAESLQDVPISITAVGGEAIAEFGITNFEQLDVPGFKIPRAGMGDNIFMRGIGSGPNLGFEQSVPIYMNGLYFGRGRGSRAGFLDLARVEIVKGPQPTYFGKNAIAGAASLIWNKPTEEFEGYVEGLYEVENEEYAVTGVVSGPLSDNIRGRVAVRYRDLNDGWLQNTELCRSRGCGRN